MDNCLIIDTGGTFNKVYNTINGMLEIDKSATAITQIAQKWMIEIKCINIIGKDSLDFDDSDRDLIVKAVKESDHKKIIIIHGTDTIDISAKHLDKYCDDKAIVLTGAMTPFSIEPIEATANFAMSCGFLANTPKYGIYLCMNGIIDDYKMVKKNKEKGCFTKI